ncbi:MAG: GNAT family N-acetyltransferase [Verrucomicrobia bacterium]|nr:MAG: GNAT family N-acetyltransferase [Verrucomicrobiota bacterium]
MSESFRIRLATPVDADTIARHRARMFQDMGEVPPNLFETFRAKSRDRLHDALARGEYIGWMASPENDSNIIVGGAGVHLQRTLPHPLSRSVLAEGRLGIIVNVFTEPEWRRRGIAEMLLRRIIEWARAERLDICVLPSSIVSRL